MKRVAFILALLMILTVSCGELQLQSDTDETTESTFADDMQDDVFFELPEKTFDGREFNILVRETVKNEFYLENQTGDVLDDAVYRRNSEVESHFDVKINAIAIDGSWSAKDNYLNTIRQSVMANDGAFDLVDGYAAIIGGLFGDGVFMNLWDVPNLRLTEEWWSPLVTETLTVNGKLYATTGDLAINMWSNFIAMYFNKELSASLKLESQYDRVKNGTWTLDALKTDIKGVANDIDGNGNMDISDMYGLVSYDSIWVDNLQVAFGISLSKKDADGKITLDYENEKTVDAYEKICQLMNENEDVFYVPQGMTDIIQISRGMFTSGNVLYFGDTLSACTAMRDSDTDFGIIPCPKWDEEQDGYYTSSRDGRTMFAIPIDVKDVDFTGLITEALAVASREYVVPAYYNVTLKAKGARDDESGEMLDIIRDGLSLEFVKEYSMQMNNAGYIIRFAFPSGANYASYVASNINSYESGLESFLEAYN